jgi:hypothetical protein
LTELSDSATGRETSKPIRIAVAGGKGGAGTTVVLALGLGLLSGGCSDKTPALLFHAGAGQRSSLDEIATLFRVRNPAARVDVSHKGSGYFIADLTASRMGDLYLPGDEHYLLQAQEKGFITDYNPATDIAAYFVTVIITPKGNPKNIRRLEDLARPAAINTMLSEKHSADCDWDHGDEIGLRVVVSACIVQPQARRTAVGEIPLAMASKTASRSAVGIWVPRRRAPRKPAKPFAQTPADRRVAVRAARCRQRRRDLTPCPSPRPQGSQGLLRHGGNRNSSGSSCAPVS